MVDEKDESSRNLLDQIEGDWDSPRPGNVATDVPSSPSLADLDSGWGADDEDDDEVEEVEPELPDERIDPAAYAVAKKARDERVEARRERRRAKADAKKARRKARADAQKSKQKGKQKKARTEPRPARPSSAGEDPPTAGEDPPADEDARSQPVARGKPMLSKTNRWMLAVAVVVFLAAAIFAAVVAR